LRDEAVLSKPGRTLLNAGDEPRAVESLIRLQQPEPPPTGSLDFALKDEQKK